MHKVEFVRQKHYGVMFVPDSRLDRHKPCSLKYIIQMTNIERGGEDKTAGSRSNFTFTSSKFSQFLQGRVYLTVTYPEFLVYLIFLYGPTVIK